MDIFHLQMELQLQLDLEPELDVELGMRVARGMGEGLSCGSANCNIDGGTCLVRLIGLQVLHEQHVAPSCCCCSQLLLLLVLHDKSVENVAA